MNKLLEVKGLTYKKNLRTILKDVNLDVESGKIIALLGENGAGKTTLMRVIVAIAKHYQGKVLLYKTWKCVEEYEFSTYQKDIFFPFFVSFTVVFTSILIFQSRSNHID